MKTPRLGRPQKHPNGRPISIYSDDDMERAVTALERQWKCSRSDVYRRAVLQAALAYPRFRHPRGAQS